MKPKERALLMGQFAKIDAYIKKYPIANILFEDAINEIQALNTKLLYEKAADNKGIVWNADKKRDITNFARDVETFRDRFIAALNKLVNEDRFVTAATLKKAKLHEQLVNKCDLFNPFMESVEKAIKSCLTESGEISLQSLRDYVITAGIDIHFRIISEDKIKACNSIKEIDKLDIPLMDAFLEGYRKTYKDGGYTIPDFSPFIDKIQGIFEKEHVFTQEVFAKDVKQWMQGITKELKGGESDYTLAGILPHKFSASIRQQFAALTEPMFGLVEQAFVAIIESVSTEGLTIEEFAANLGTALKAFKIPNLTIDQRQGIKSEHHVYDTLFENIKLSEAFGKSVDTNSAIYIISQPIFLNNLIAEINAWKANCATAIAAQADTLIQFDGCKLSAEKFKTEVFSRIQNDFVKGIIEQGLENLENLELDTKEAISQLDPWESTWKNTLELVDAQSIYDTLVETPEKLRDFAQNITGSLGAVQGFEYAVIKAIEAIEKAGEKDRQKIIAKVEQVQKTVEEVGNRLLYIERCKNNAESAKHAPKEIKPLLEHIAGLFETLNTNHALAKPKLTAVIEDCNAMVKIQNDAKRSFVDFMFGTVCDLAIKAFKVDKVPIFGGLLKSAVKSGKDAAVDWALDMNNSIVPLFDKELDVMSNYASQAKGLKAIVKEYVTGIEKVVDHYVGTMLEEVHNQTNTTIESQIKGVTNQNFLESGFDYKEFEYALDEIGKQLMALSDEISAMVFSPREMEEKMIATFVFEEKHMFYKPDESWYKPYDFTMLYSEGFVEKIAVYGAISASEVRSNVGVIEGSFSNFWHFLNNASSAVVAEFSGQDNVKFVYMAGVIDKIVEWAKNAKVKV